MAREEAARELGGVTDRLQGLGNLQEEERAMLLRKQQQLTHTLEEHSTQVSLVHAAVRGLLVKCCCSLSSDQMLLFLCFSSPCKGKVDSMSGRRRSALCH